MRWWPFQRSEERADAGNTVAEALLNSAAGGSPSIVNLASVEACLGIWARSLSAAQVEPVTRVTSALTPGQLANMGRALGNRGEYCALIEVDDAGQVVLRQAAAWEVRGGLDPESWRYALELPTPGGIIRRTALALQVIHVRINARADAPWRGVSPLAATSNTAALAGWIEQRLAQESRTSTGYVLTTPDGQGFDDETAAKLKGLDGKLLALETSAQGWGGGATAAPARKDYAPGRLGFDPPGSIATLRKDIRSDIYASFGVSESAALGSGAAARESHTEDS